MKRYSNNDNLDIDPTRFLFQNNHNAYNANGNNGNNHNNHNNNLLLGFSKPINKLQDDIMINNLYLKKTKSNYFQKKQPNQNQKNVFNDDDISLQFLPKNNSNQLVPLTDNNSITNYNNDKFRFKNMSQELMDKDEEIQKYKNEVYQLQIELNQTKKEKSKVISSEMENKLLKEKLNEHYSISRELSQTKHTLKRERIDNESNENTIQLLKNIIHKQHVQLTTKEYEDSETEDDIESEYETETEDESEYASDSEEEIEIEDVKKVIQKTQKTQKTIYGRIEILRWLKITSNIQTKGNC